ncbi:MAG TPA: DUF2846 domain-containing protein [Sphingobium sp.]|nr:DUF2846 domain-containing protein [Sphingobium sp.]
MNWKLMIAGLSIATITGAASNAFAQQEVAVAAPSVPSKGTVIFFRKGGLFGAAISCAVHENGAKLTSLPPGKFAIVEVEPGIHEFTVASEAKDTLRLEVEPGETYYAKCNVTMGVMAGRPNLSPSDKASYDAMSAKLKPVKQKVEGATTKS